MYLVFKRLFDFLFSLVFLLCISPIFIGIFIMLFIANDQKVFFLQKRPGKNEKIFTIIKFKTMNDRKDCNGALLPDFQRITKMGRFIRNNSLDEIPQLINVLVGNMSIVGPRPLLVEYLEHYNDEQRKRHHVKPGITGWAQINGRNAISWEKKFEYDLWYVENISFFNDVIILIKTVKKVLKKEDVSASNEVTMELFKGSGNKAN